MHGQQNIKIFKICLSLRLNRQDEERNKGGGGAFTYQFLEWKSNKYFKCYERVSVYPVCKTHLFCRVLYCRLWPVWPCHIFPHYLINGIIFGKKKLLNMKCVF